MNLHFFDQISSIKCLNALADMEAVKTLGGIRYHLRGIL